MRRMIARSSSSRCARADRRVGSGCVRLAPKVGRRGDRQHAADRLDPVRLPMLVDERHHHFARRSSSAWAKNADAFFRISLARFSSKFSRSSCFSRCAFVGRQARPLAAIALRLAHPATQRLRRYIPASRRPIGSPPTATDARRRDRKPSGLRAHATLGSTCLVVPWAPSSLGMGPPTNPVRFRRARSGGEFDC